MMGATRKRAGRNTGSVPELARGLALKTGPGIWGVEKERTMAVDWSEEIAIANLAEEPALSDELSSMNERIASLDDPPHAVLDFQDVGYINSSNIAQLLAMRKTLAAGGRRLILCGINDEVQSVLVVSGLDKLFRIMPDMMTAIASVQIEDTPAS